MCILIIVFVNLDIINSVLASKTLLVIHYFSHFITVDCIEHMVDQDSEIEADFSESTDWTLASQDLISPSKENLLTTDEQRVLWGLALFTCMFQT